MKTEPFTLRIPIGWHEDLRLLARCASISEGKDISVAELVKRAILDTYKVGSLDSRGHLMTFGSGLLYHHEENVKQGQK